MNTQYSPSDRTIVLASSIIYRMTCQTLHKGHGTSVCLRASGWLNMQFANPSKTYDIERLTCSEH